MLSEHAVEVLLAEDNPGDVTLIRKAIKDIRSDISVHVVRDGIEAAELLKQKDARRPAILILGLNTGDGRELRLPSSWQAEIES